jgi:CRISPR-associated protein Cas1
VRKLLNTLYVTTADSYLSLDGETVLVLQGDTTLGRIPLHNIEGIVYFGYKGASPALMGACAEREIDLSFLTPAAVFWPEPPV